jgi:hypothetical protein
VSSLALNALVGLAFFCLPIGIACLALRRFRLSRTANRRLYAAMAGLCVCSALWVLAAFFIGQSSVALALILSAMMLPLWILLRAVV